jgi:hypothetical protein
MVKRNWIWILAFCTGSFLGQAAHALAVSLTYNLNFFDSNGFSGTENFFKSHYGQLRRSK